jgi:hypothetical protein
MVSMLERMFEEESRPLGAEDGRGRERSNRKGSTPCNLGRGGRHAPPRASQSAAALRLAAWIQQPPHYTERSLPCVQHVSVQDEAIRS